jgi:hypothetical protein
MLLLRHALATLLDYGTHTHLTLWLHRLVNELPGPYWNHGKFASEQSNRISLPRIAAVPMRGLLRWGMPSYRITITIGTLRAGAQPPSVLPAAASAAGELTTVEASDIAIVSGMPRITVRFTADGAGFAKQVAGAVVSAVSALAEPLAATVTERVKGRWYVVR